MALFQVRLKRVMKRRGLRVADLARIFDCPYTTVREWVLNGRDPQDGQVVKRLTALEKK